jgi:hypothetical protein
VEVFFDLLKSELQKVKFDLAKVYNVDETLISIIQGTRATVASVKEEASRQIVLGRKVFLADTCDMRECHWGCCAKADCVFQGLTETGSA